jgi:hypothetical protein
VEIVNTTPFRVGTLPGRVSFPGHTLTLVVKGTYDLHHEGTAVPAEEPLLPTGDEFHPDDEEQAGSLRYASDFAYTKPRADLLLVGSCHAPDGKPQLRCPVTFRVGEFEKTLVVFAERHWKAGLLHPSIVLGEPFTRLEIGYESAYGGEGYARNPLGIGKRKVEGDG